MGNEKKRGRLRKWKGSEKWALKIERWVGITGGG